jgi:uncharacterized membrane protein YdbT with pleckstrin-like domain
VPLTPKLLGAGEQVVIHTRTHGKALIWPAIALVVLGALVGAMAALIPTDWGSAGAVGVALLGLALAGWLVLRPFLRWLSTTYTVTTRRLITRSGVVRRFGTDLPLMRINDVTFQTSLSDRVFGCGTLSIRTGSEGGAVELHDVPDVEEVHRTVSELIFGSDEFPGIRRPYR